MINEPIDAIALRNQITGKKAKHIFALRHKETGLYFHKNAKSYYGPEGGFYTAPWPMFRRSRSGFASWLANFEKPEDWEIEELDV